MNVNNELLYSEVPISQTKIHFALVGFTVILLLYVTFELPSCQTTFGFPLIRGLRNQDYTVFNILKLTFFHNY